LFESEDELEPLKNESELQNLPGSAKEPRTKSRHPTVILITLTLLVLLVSYVETMILPGVPEIQKDFGASATTASWITSIVLVVGAAISPIFGKLGDARGKKKVFLLAIGFYTVGVGLAGFAPTIYFLIFSRALQGAGFAAFPLALSMVTDIFPKERLASAQGAIVGSAAISSTAGLVVGAYIVQDLGWRYAFHTALILSLILLPIAATMLVESQKRPNMKIDYLGALMLSGGITFVLLYLTLGSSQGWYSLETISLLVTGIVLSFLFFAYERGRQNALIQLNLLKIRNVLVANLISIISGLANFMLFYAFIFYAELPSPAGLGLTVISTGLALAPATLVMLVAGPVAGKLVSKIGPKPILLSGTAILVVGFTTLILNRGTTLNLTLDAALSMVGIVFLLVPVVNMVSVSLPKEDITIGQGINNTLKSLGQSIGPVIATAVMTSYSIAITRTVGGVTEVVGSLPTATAFNYIFGIGIVLTIIAAIIGFATKNYVLNKKAENSVRAISEEKKMIQG
jgi:MFS family permease